MPNIKPTGKASKIFLKNKNKEIYFKAIDWLTTLTIAASQISGIELTEDQLLFIRSRQFRKIVMTETISILQKFLFGDEKASEAIQNQNEKTCKIEIVYTNTVTEKKKKSKKKSKKDL